MPTRRLYYDDSFQDNFTAQVLSCQPMADMVAGQDSTCWGVLLDQTHLYPTSGGQPNDLGKLGDANVLDVRDLENDEVLHVVDRPVATGKVDGCIHWPRRFDHMQQHTGQHLLSAVFQERFGLPTVSFHLGESVSTIDLRGPQPTPVVLEGVARAANAIVFEDREVTVRYGTAEQFARMGVRKQVERAGTLRAIEIGGIDLQPCGGTHVRRTGQIGTVLLRGCSKMRQDWRVEFLCGHRAEVAARRDADLIARVAEQMKCAASDLGASVERLVAEREVAAKKLKTMLPKLADAEAAAFWQSQRMVEGTVRTVVQILEGVLPEYLQFYATALAASEKVVALVAVRESGAILFAQHPGSGCDMNALLRAVLDQFGGKGGGSRDFARGALSDPGKIADALAFGRSLVEQAQVRSGTA
ncbi:MAG TPA: DHHA1 domain-containing protein [Candidatus Acidoferrum sp.]|nr:DHHA1 domain-containing protein [Candidatus Acidoferrum sp.]